MTALHETARAKLNLTLEVLGRRADGYHELRSLVAFPALGDRLAFTPGESLSLAIDGPFAEALSGETGNLVLHAASAVKGAIPSIGLGSFLLTKTLPVASGLGGGSADAAAALRLVARANPGKLDGARMRTLAAALGSDVTVCLDSRGAMMSGRGEIVSPVDPLPACGVVLANPGVPLAARDVYAALDARPLSGAAKPAASPSFGGSFERLIDYALKRGNDLEAPASRLITSIRGVLASLDALPGARLARLSGSGATCFALFATEGEARKAATALKAERPDWWIEASVLSGEA